MFANFGATQSNNSSKESTAKSSATMVALMGMLHTSVVEVSVVRRFWLLVYMMRVPLITLVVLGAALPLAFWTPMFHGVADIEPLQVSDVSLLAFLLLSEALSCGYLVLLYGEERADGWQKRPSPNERIATWEVVALYAVAAVGYAVFLGAVRARMVLANPDHVTLPRFLILAAVGFGLGIFCVMGVFLFVLRVAKPEDDPALEVFAFPALLIFRNRPSFRTRVNAVKGTRAASSSDDRGSKDRNSVDRNSTYRNYASHRGVVSSFLVRLLGPGYGTAPSDKPQKLHAGHRFGFFLMLLFFLSYVATGKKVFEELSKPGQWSHGYFSPCVLTYLLLLLMFWCCVLSGLTFFFDRFRVPAILMLGLAFFGIAHIPGSSDHVFETVARPVKAPLRAPQEIFERIPERLVVVAAAGGGIQSAAWTSTVLCGLRQGVPAFSDHVAVLSGVSGGSVGVMFYLRSLEDDPSDVEAATSARESSLEAVAWGLTHPDLRRAIFPGILGNWSRADRGWALEKAILKSAHFNNDDRLLAGETSRKWPALLLNSTDAETGDPMVFTNSNFPKTSGQAHELTSFHSRYDGRDVRLETAARMSAAFPFVSPVARPDQTGGQHFADGGYFDNSGLFALSEFIKEATAPREGEKAVAHARPKILLLQINAFPDSDPATTADDEKWYYQIYAPILAMLNVRSEGQVVRDVTSGEDFRELMTGRGYATAWALVRYNTDAIQKAGHAMQKTGQGTGRACPTKPPLSWHLTALERECIDEAWGNVSGEMKKQVQEFLAGKDHFPASGCSDSDDAKKKKATVYVTRCAAK